MYIKITQVYVYLQVCLCYIEKALSPVVMSPTRVLLWRDLRNCVTSHSPGSYPPPPPVASSMVLRRQKAAETNLQLDQPPLPTRAASDLAFPLSTFHMLQG